MSLSANADWRIMNHTGAAPVAMQVKASSVLYWGSLCSHDTTEGAIKPFDGTQTDRLVGWHFGDSVTGTSSAPYAMGRIYRGGFSVKNLTCGGLLNTTADYGAKVYATDDGTYTVTDPGTGQEVGRVVADPDRDSGKATIHFELKN